MVSNTYISQNIYLYYSIESLGYKYVYSGGIMEILIPSNLDFKSLITFSFPDCNEEDDEYIYNYESMSTVEPFGMLLMGSKIRSFKNNTPNAIHRNIINYHNSTYAGNMGYFYSIGEEYGRGPGELGGNNNYIPIKKLDIKKSYLESLNIGKEIYCYLEDEVAGRLATVLSRGNKELYYGLKYCITEILRNVYEHSKSNDLWYAGQYWPSKDMIEIAILDEGIGIMESLRHNRRHNIKNNLEAIKLSLLPGVSKSICHKKSSKIYENIGYGLYMLKGICEKVGNFAICSGDTALYISSNQYRDFNIQPIKGTIIRLRIRPSKCIETEKMIREIALEGDKIIKENNIL